MSDLPLNFSKYADFRGTHFDSTADFSGAHFDSTADFSYAQFHGTADFSYAQFHGTTNFTFTHFDSTADFAEVKFDSTASFSAAEFHGTADFGAQFRSTVDFSGTEFHSTTFYTGAHFNSLANFRSTRFDGDAYFPGVKFYSTADFSGARFKNIANFIGTQFQSIANFSLAWFQLTADFSATQFDHTPNFVLARFGSTTAFGGAVLPKGIDFRSANFDLSGVADFSSSCLIDTLFIGGYQGIQKFDLRLVKLLPGGTHTITVGRGAALSDTMLTVRGSGAHFLLERPVDLKIQHEKLTEFVSLPNSLDYFSKRFIVDGTKEASFKGDEFSRERFEMDFIFEKSTLHQKHTTFYETYSPANPVFWAQSLYYYTMGLGYRPFWLAWWVIGFVVVFGAIYMLWIPHPIRQYVYKDDPMKATSPSLITPPKPLFTENLIHCLYFSAMVFFTVRLKNDLLTSFDLRQKQVIVFEWLLGIAIYIAFLTLSKAGSILQNLKSLFVG